MAKEKKMLIVVSAVKNEVKEQEMRSGDDFVDGVNEQVHLIIRAAVARCKANGRQTLKAEDIWTMAARKMNQILAIEKSTKNQIETAFTKIYQNIGKAELLNGFQKNYTPSEENGAKLPPESKKVQFKAEDQIKMVKKELTELLDISAIKDKTNCIAKADIEIDGVVLLKDVPATYLLYLEHKLADLVAFARKLPILDQSENWKRDDALGLWATEAVTSVRTKKVEEIQVIVPPTKEHPAQTAKFVKDVPEGHWATIKYSGAMQGDKVEAILERIETLQRAVKSARAQANVTVVDESLKPGAIILDYIFG